MRDAVRLASVVSRPPCAGPRQRSQHETSVWAGRRAAWRSAPSMAPKRKARCSAGRRLHVGPLTFARSPRARATHPARLTHALSRSFPMHPGLAGELPKEALSPWRDRSKAENRCLFERMKAGRFAEGEAVLRMRGAPTPPPPRPAFLALALDLACPRNPCARRSLSARFLHGVIISSSLFPPARAVSLRGSSLGEFSVVGSCRLPGTLSPSSAHRQRMVRSHGHIRFLSAVFLHSCPLTLSLKGVSTRLTTTRIASCACV